MCQLLRLDEIFHEPDLVKAGRKEKAREFRQHFLAKMAPAVKIVAALKIAICKVLLVRIEVAGKPACNRPRAAGIEGLEQGCIGHESYDAPVAV